MSKKIRIQKARIVLGKDMQKGSSEVFACKLRQGYNKVSSVEMYAVNKSGQGHFGVSLKEESGSITDSIPFSSYEASSSVSPNEKGKTLNIAANNQDVFVSIELLKDNNGVDDFVLDVVFVLENDPDFTNKSC